MRPVTEQAADSAPQEQVVAQNPPAGTKLTNDRGVSLTVSVGKPGVEVPNVVGKTEAEARAIMTAANLPPSRYANYQGRADLPDALLRSVCVGCVLSMTPGAGTLAPPGTSVYLAVRRE